MDGISWNNGLLIKMPTVKVLYLFSIFRLSKQMLGMRIGGNRARYSLTARVASDRKLTFVYGISWESARRRRLPRWGRRALLGGDGKCQTVCKPGSVAGFPRSTAIHLGRSSPNASRDQPERRLENPPEPHVAPKLDMGLRRSYSVLLPVGFTVPSPFPGPRCALTAPFHPYLPGEPGIGGLLSVALSLGSPPPVVNRHRVSAEPGLSSPRITSKGDRPTV